MSQPSFKSALLATGLIATATFTGGVSAQNDYPLLKKSTGTMGSTLNLDYSGAPQNRMMVLMFSLTGGPVPLKLMFGGNDPRSIEVGVEFIPGWLFTSSGATGSGNYPLPIPPNAPALQGLEIHLQTMVAATSGANVVDKLSNKVVIHTAAPGTSAVLTARLGDGQTPVGPGRGLMSVFFNRQLSSGKGDVVLAAGGVGNILSAKGLQTSEIFDFHKLSIRPGPNLTAARALHTATTLRDGTVLLAGGVDTLGVPLNTAEIYDPVKNTFAPTATTMTAPRAGHAAALLQDGRVLVVGGAQTLDLLKITSAFLSSAEIYNPATKSWSKTSGLSNKVIAPSLDALKTGKVLVSGGATLRTIFGIPLSVDTLTTCQLYNPSTGSWSNAGSMRQHRGVHSLNTVLLADGRLLITGGIKANISMLPPPTTFAGAVAISACEFYTPATNSWTSIPAMTEARSGHTASLMPNGRVLVVGGAKGAIDAAIPLDSVQEFNPATNAWVRSFRLKGPRAGHGAAILPDGLLVVFGGQSGTTTPTLRSVEAIHP